MTSAIASSKVRQYSPSLQREFHADLFIIGDAPTFSVVLFGGSGVSQAKYLSRSMTVVPIFDAALSELRKEFGFVFMYVTAPFDIRFARFDEHPEDRRRWVEHCTTDLLPLLPPSPLFFIGFSGGIELGLTGFANNPRCQGAGGLGADADWDRYQRPAHWSESLRLYYNRSDRVYSKHRSTLAAVENDSVELFASQPGGHELIDYVRNGSFAGMIRWAGRTLHE